MSSRAKILIAACCLGCVPAFATISFVTTPGALGSNDSTDWAQLGEDQTVLTGPFIAISSFPIAVTGNFGADNTGLVADVCPDGDGTCTWGPTSTGMVAGDTDIWAFDNNTGLGTGPLTLTFGTSLLGAGAWIQGDTAGTYVAELQVYNAGGLVGTSTVGEGTSDGAGDPIFLGAIDTVQEITQIVFSLTSCAGCTNDGDFAIDTLLMKDATSATPEPSSMLLLGGGLAAMAWVLRRRSGTNRLARQVSSGGNKSLDNRRIA